MQEKIDCNRLNGPNPFLDLAMARGFKHQTVLFFNKGPLHVLEPMISFLKELLDSLHFFFPFLFVHQYFILLLPQV